MKQNKIDTAWKEIELRALKTSKTKPTEATLELCRKVFFMGAGWMFTTLVADVTEDSAAGIKLMDDLDAELRWELLAREKGH